VIETPISVTLASLGIPVSVPFGSDARAEEERVAALLFERLVSGRA